MSLTKSQRAVPMRKKTHNFASECHLIPRVHHPSAIHSLLQEAILKLTLYTIVNPEE